MRSPWLARGGCAALLLWLLASCSSAGGGGALAGALLADTGDIAASADQNFALSPDGRWLSYTSTAGDPFRPAVMIYDLRAGQRHQAEPAAEAAELAAQGLGPLLHGGCWSDDGARVTLPGDIAAFDVAPIGPGAALTARRTPAAEQARLRSCPQDGGRQQPAVSVEQLGAREVALARPEQPGAQVARFSSANPTVTAVEIQFLTTSPDGDHIAYVVVERQGSFVTTRGYLQNLTVPDGRQLVAEPVFGPLRFSHDGMRLYGFTETQAGRGIYQWDVQP